MPIQISPNNTEGNSSVNLLEMVARNALGWLGQAFNALGQLRVSVDAGSLSTITTVTTVTTVTSVTAVAAVTNQVSMGGFNAADHVPSLMNIAAQGLRSRITVS
jgi:hypothetical protein